MYVCVAVCAFLEIERVEPWSFQPACSAFDVIRASFDGVLGYLYMFSVSVPSFFVCVSVFILPNEMC